MYRLFIYNNAHECEGINMSLRELPVPSLSWSDIEGTVLFIFFQMVEGTVRNDGTIVDDERENLS
jgi:hypothetical protein